MTGDPMLYGITRYTMLVEVDYMGFGAGIAAEPNPDGGWINAADLPALLEQARADAEQRVSEAILLEYATNMPTRTYEQGQRDEHAKWSVLIKDRIRDLQFCTKHDDCMGKADILLVILDDYDYGVAREEKS